MATVGDSAPKAAYGAVNVLNSAATKVPTNPVEYNKLLVQNLGPNAIWLGWDNSVSNVNGLKLAAGAQLLIEMVSNPTKSTTNPQLWAIADTADQSSPANTRYHAWK